MIQQGLILGFLLLVHGADAQALKAPSRADSLKSPDSVKLFVEVMPSFPGGEQALHEYLFKNIHLVEGSSKQVQTKVVASFYVEKDGAISDIEIEKGDGGYGLGAEVIRVLKNMPKWNPGMQDGKPVTVLYMLPVEVNTNGN